MLHQRGVQMKMAKGVWQRRRMLATSDRMLQSRHDGYIGGVSAEARRLESFFDRQAMEL